MENMCTRYQHGGPKIPLFFAHNQPEIAQAEYTIAATTQMLSKRSPYFKLLLIYYNLTLESLFMGILDALVTFNFT